MAKAGLTLGTFFQLWAAIVSLYTLWLLSNLYQEHKRKAVSMKLAIIVLHGRSQCSALLPGSTIDQKP